MQTLKKWQQTVKPLECLIVQATVKDGSSSWQPFPIGMGWQFGLNYKVNTQIGTHEKSVFCAIHPDTDQRRRRSYVVNRRKIIENLRKIGVQNVSLPHKDYFAQLPTYKFVISPEGNGIDCHRHYEALLAGAIPIIERHPLTEEKYKGLPILYTTDYSELTEDYLTNKYAEMLDVEYDFTKLSIKHYDTKTKEYIKECGNHWMLKHLGQKWYK